MRSSKFAACLFLGMFPFSILLALIMFALGLSYPEVAVTVGMVDAVWILGLFIIEQ